MIKIYIKTMAAKRILKIIAGEEEYEIILDSPDGLKKIKSRHCCRLKD